MKDSTGVPAHNLSLRPFPLERAQPRRNAQAGANTGRSS
jgi:hypothetical protein